ncbi:beta-hydroxyacyl-ACP dehydratase [Streptomyces sp. 4503]|uniref:Beta-hydroxyacyl-ACP dehydratase n=1 Tax=Streptomyces niphimycinicus TaxID=2842201 RepID=A0ABS6C732_9ACTN|nr:beta-hydroxyacyl-ACP dehydratase [Streptomyces niphimycinicus]MBU3862700.1 beta-hydroxyacyl-ACP dehydratase [Streptomyces niphimycinicus]
MITLEHADIRRILPHRHPVLLVDRVLELEPGSRIVATKTVTGSEPCYAGLEEDLPASAYAYPASLLVESFGQTGAVLWLYSAAMAGERSEGTLIFGSAREVTITGRAYPGDVLRHTVEIDQLIGDNAFMRGETWVGDRRIATLGSVLAVVREGLAVGTGS